MNSYTTSLAPETPVSETQIEVQKLKTAASADRLAKSLASLEGRLQTVLSEPKTGQGVPPDGSGGLCRLAADLYEINSGLEASLRTIQGILDRLEL